MAAVPSTAAQRSWAQEELSQKDGPHIIPPTPSDLLELSSSIYKDSSRLHNEAARQGLRVYYDERLSGDVRVALLVRGWFPTAYSPFDWSTLNGQRVPVVVALRGTVQNLVGNTRTNLQLLYNKMVDEHYIPDAAADVATLLQGWLHTLMARHPALRPPAAAAAAAVGVAPGTFTTPANALVTTSSSGGDGSVPVVGLDVHITGHSLGGMLAEVVAVDCLTFAAGHGIQWRCTTFESPGLPDIYIRAAQSLQPSEEFWKAHVVGYLSAPNPINMLYGHLGSVVHVLAPWEQSWSHSAKAVAVDVARVAGWVVVGGAVVSSGGRVLSALRNRGRDEEEGGPVAIAAAAAEMAGLCPLDPEGPAGPGSLGAAALGIQAFHLAASAGGSSGAAGTGSGMVIPSVLEGARLPAAASSALVAAAAPAGRGGATAGLLAASAGSSSIMVPAVLTAGPSSAAAATGAMSTALVTTTAGSSSSSSMAAAAGATASYILAASEAAVNHSVTHAVTGAVRHMGPRGLGASLGALTSALMSGSHPALRVLKCLAGVLGVEVDELWDQHLLASMRPCFDPHTGQLQERYRRVMKTWPQLGDRRRVLVRAAQQLAKWTLPSLLCQENIGVMNMFCRASMVEARCSQLEGYVAESAVTGCALEGPLVETEEEEDVVMEGAVGEEGGMELVAVGTEAHLHQQQQQQQQQQVAMMAASVGAAAPATATPMSSSRYMDVDAQVALPPPPSWEVQLQQLEEDMDIEQQAVAGGAHVTTPAGGPYQQQLELEALAMQLLPPHLDATAYATAPPAAAAAGLGGQQGVHMQVPLVSVQLSPTIEPPEAPRDWIMIEPLRQEAAAAAAAAGGSSRAGSGAAAAAAAAAAGRSGVAQAAGRRQLQGQLAPAGL